MSVDHRIPFIIPGKAFQAISAIDRDIGTKQKETSIASFSLHFFIEK